MSGFRSVAWAWWVLRAGRMVVAWAWRMLMFGAVAMVVSVAGWCLWLDGDGPGTCCGAGR